MISRPIALASAMSLPTSRPSQTSAHSADDVRRGSTAYRRAPLRTPRRRWWKKIGCVSRALLPHRTIRSVSSASRYELVPPPAPNTVARPATLGACQVRLQLSMLLLPRTARLNFWAAKLTSLVALRAAEDAEGRRAVGRLRGLEPGDGPVERLVPASRGEARRPSCRGRGAGSVERSSSARACLLRSDDRECSAAVRAPARSHASDDGPASYRGATPRWFASGGSLHGWDRAWRMSTRLALLGSLCDRLQ